MVAHLVARAEEGDRLRCAGTDRVGSASFGTHRLTECWICGVLGGQIQHSVDERRRRRGVLPPAYGMMYGMRRTTVYLPDDLKAALARAAKASGRSEAALIREGVERVTAATSRPRPRLPLFDSGDPALAERADELLEGFGEA